MMFKSTRRRFVAIALFAALMGATFGAIPAALAQDAQIIINDMTLPPDAALHGTEGLSWGGGEASPQPITVPAQNWKGEWFQAMTSWGQVYIPREGSGATNTRCQIRNLTTKLLMNTGQWVTVQSSGSPEGAAFVENFANNSSMDAGARDESANGGGLSFIVGVGAWAGHNYHFWPTGGRATVDVANVIGVFTTCEARLIMDNASGPDDRAQCKNVLQMGADWWLNTSTGWLPDWSANSGIGGTRAKWVTSNWQSFSFCSRVPADITANPPVGPTVPAAPSNLSASAASSSQINLSWTDNAANETGFKIERKTGAGGTYAQIAAVGANVTAYSNTGLTASTQYYYRVCANNSTGNSGYSNEANATTSGTANVNLALNRPAVASSVENSGTPASSAFDGNSGSRWSSVLGVDPQWIQVDLGSTKTVRRVILNWETAYARAFLIQVSTNGSSWTTVWSTSSGGGGNQNLTFSAASARYVRMYGTQRGTSWGYSLYEFEVWAN